MLGGSGYLGYLQPDWKTGHLQKETVKTKTQTVDLYCFLQTPPHSFSSVACFYYFFPAEHACVLNTLDLRSLLFFSEIQRFSGKLLSHCEGKETETWHCMPGVRPHCWQSSNQPELRFYTTGHVCKGLVSSLPCKDLWGLNCGGETLLLNVSGYL